jgi:hypothetical protein
MLDRATAGAVRNRGYDSNAPDSIAQDGGCPGHPLYVFPGYGVNQARNNGADLEPIPITPVKHQNWPEMQIQLNNGWMMLNWGKKLPYDTYLKLLASSEDRGRAYLAPGPRGVAAGNLKIGPSPLNVQTWQQSGPGAQPNNPGGPGQTVGAITNGGYYG